MARQRAAPARGGNAGDEEIGEVALFPHVGGDAVAGACGTVVDSKA